MLDEERGEAVKPTTSVESTDIPDRKTKKIKGEEAILIFVCRCEWERYLYYFRQGELFKSKNGAICLHMFRFMKVLMSHFLSDR